MKDKIWIKISVSIAGGAVSDEYMINDLEDYVISLIDTIGLINTKKIICEINNKLKTVKEE